MMSSTVDLHKDCLKKKHACGFDGCDYISYFKWCIRRHMTETLKHQGAPNPTFRTALPSSSSSSSSPSRPPPLARSRVITADADVDSSQHHQPYDIRLVSGFKVWLSGSSGAGKSVWIINLIKHLPTVCVEPPTKVLFVYKTMQDIYNEVDGLVSVFMQDRPGLGSLVWQTLNDWVEKGEKVLLIADDMVMTKDKAFLDLIATAFTVGRHTGVSIVFATQKCYPNTDQLRMAHNNANYTVYFNNMHDRTEFRRLVQRAFPHRTDSVMAIFDRVMAQQYGHLIISFLPNPRKITFLSELFDRPHIVKAYMTDSSAAATFPNQAPFREMYLVDRHLMGKVSAATPRPPLPTRVQPPFNANAARDDDNDDDDDDDIPLLAKTTTPPPTQESDSENAMRVDEEKHACQFCGGLFFNSSAALNDHISRTHSQPVRRLTGAEKRRLLRNLPGGKRKKRVKLTMVEDGDHSWVDDRLSHSSSSPTARLTTSQAYYPNRKKVNQWAVAEREAAEREAAEREGQ